MKSFLKKFLAVAIACVSVLSMLALVACGEEKSAYANVYMFEAELTNAEDWDGGGWSGSAQGTGLIAQDEDKYGASGGYFVTYTWTPQLKVYFEITASEATTAKLSLRLSNELKQVIEMNSERLDVQVNDVSVNYTPFQLKASSSDDKIATSFDNYVIGEINLKAGENVISLIVGEWKFDESHYFGPVFDAIKVESNATLSMIEYTENIVA